jgi:hypothetical protein
MATPKKRTTSGKPIDERFAHLIPEQLTDEAIAERNLKPARVSKIAKITRDADFDMQLARLEDELENGTDPFREAADEARAVNPGHSFRFLSDRVVKARGLRGFEPVKTTDGDDVKVGGMTLGSMPAEVADVRNERYRRMAALGLDQAEENLAERQERMISAANASGLRPLRGGDVVTSESDPDLEATIGLNRSRGGAR